MWNIQAERFSMGAFGSKTAPVVDNGPGTPDIHCQPVVKCSSPLKPFRPTVDGYNRDKWASLIYPSTNTTLEPGEMLQKLCPLDRSDLPSLVPPTMRKRGTRANSTYCDYLNKLSVKFNNKKSPFIIKFHQIETTACLDHPTGTICRPDIVAVRDYNTPLDKISWSHLEATGDDDSGQSQADEDAQALAYTNYHLQARPDLMSVVGISIKASNFKLFLSNACQVYNTPAIEWTSDIAPQLLSAWMWRLYHPEVDSTINVNMKASPPTFRVDTHDELIILCAGESIGRRTMILAQDDPNSSIVIKEQYIEDSCRSNEGTLLGQIHEDGRFPGVVRLEHFEYVTHEDNRISVQHRTDESTVTRYKIRLVMKDRGVGMMDVMTPRVLLMGMYDVLEISRILYRKYQILHRDISPGNVLFLDHSAAYTDKLPRHDLEDMCFSEYLIKRSTGQADSDPDSDRRQRLATRVIQIDFDNAENQDPNNCSSEEPKPRTGTPPFMARMVRSNEYPAGFYALPPMPAVASQLRVNYESLLNGRLKAFPPNNVEYLLVPEGQKMGSSKFQHLLRYDAESVFWCLLWWCIQARPDKFPDEELESCVWSNFLSDGHKTRNINFILTFPMDCLHSSYSQLAELLNDMRRQLQGDLVFSELKNGQPEYVHEAFQRLILNFLITYKDAPFMDLEKDHYPRRVKEVSIDRNTRITKRANPDTDESIPNKRRRRE